MSLLNPKAIFDEVRRMLGRGLTQQEVDGLNQAIDDAVEGTIVVTAPEGPLRPTKKGIDLIHSFEQCRLEAYPDPGSKNGEPYTIGWGSTGPGIVRGTRWTQAQADERFQKDLTKFSEGVVRLLAGARTTPWQFDALVSFAYNVGLNALGNSTLLRKHKAGDFEGAAQEFLRWVNNDGKRMKGLVSRRAAEAALYRGQV